MPSDHNAFELKIFVPDKKFASIQAREAVFTTPTGRMGVMSGHMPMIAAISSGILEIQDESGWKTAAVSEGFADIAPDHVEVFVDTAEWADEIDAARAREALERATLLMKEELSIRQHMQVKIDIAKALARLKAAGAVS